MSDSQQITPYGGDQTRDVAVAPAAPTTIPMDQQLAMMRQALTDPNVDPGKAREMFALMREMQQDARQAEFNRAKIAAIRAMPAIYKRGNNTHLNARYAKFEDLHRAAMPVLARHNLTLDFRVGSEGRNVTVQPILRHDNGYIEEGGTMAAPPTEGKGLNVAQSTAITTSYLKRHSMKAMLNIIEDDEDHDGGIRPDTQLNDRQQNLLVDAQDQADAGTYAAWFGRLSVKDKAVLIGSGHHARLGGAPALPGASADQTAETPRDTPPADQGQTQAQPQGQRQQTADEWVEQYESDCRTAPDLDTLQRIQTKGARALATLKDRGLAELHDRAIQAGSEAFQRLSGDVNEQDGE